MSTLGHIDLKKVGKIGQKYKDIVFGYIHEVQLLFPNDTPYFNIVDLIKHLCLLYYYHIFNSSILADQEQCTFLDLLSKHNKNFGHNIWHLLYRKSRDTFTRDIFMEKCHGKSNLLCFIHTANNNVFGGYTKSGWKVSNHSGLYTKDDDAFIFGIRSCNDYEPIILNVKENMAQSAMGHHVNYCCIFGENWVIYVRFYGEHTGNQQCECYEKPPIQYQFTSGSNAEEKVIDLEIFQWIQ